MTMDLVDQSSFKRSANMSSRSAFFWSESLIAVKAARSVCSAFGSTNDLPDRADSVNPSIRVRVGLLRARSRAVSALDLRHTAVDSASKHSSAMDHIVVSNPVVGLLSSRGCCTGPAHAKPKTRLALVTTSEKRTTDEHIVAFRNSLVLSFGS